MYVARRRIMQTTFRRQYAMVRDDYDDEAVVGWRAVD
jgi:hypothetical protein